MSTNNYTSPLGAPDSMMQGAPEPIVPPVPAPDPMATAPAAPAAQAHAKSKGKSKGAAIAAGVVGAAAAGAGIAYAADRFLNDDDNAATASASTHDDADDASDNYLTDTNVTEIDDNADDNNVLEEEVIEELADNGVRTPSSTRVDDGISDFQRSAIDHADDNFEAWNGVDPGDVVLPDVNPNLYTDDLSADIILIDEDDYDAPGYFFEPTNIEVSNIEGNNVTLVEAVLPTGEQVFLVDSDSDGSFDLVYDTDGNVLAEGSDLASTTVDDAQAILMDKGMSPDGASITGAQMADVDETTDDYPASVDGDVAVVDTTVDDFVDQPIDDSDFDSFASDSIADNFDDTTDDFGDFGDFEA